MTRPFRLVVLLALAICPVLLAAEGDSASRTGWFSDEWCAPSKVKSDKVGPNNRDCVQKCLKKGAKMVFIDEKSKVLYAVENPEAARSLGVRVSLYRYQGVLLSGALAGLSGAFLASEVIGNWREGQTLGLGFIALAALILSNWNPIRLMFFAWLFGFAQAIPLRLNDAPIISALPPQFIRMIPYVVTIIAIAGFVGRVRPPAAAGKAYEGGGV